MQRNGEKGSRRSSAQWRERVAGKPAGLLIRSFTLFVFFTLGIHALPAQQGIIQGTVIDKKSKEPVPYVHVFLTSGLSGTISDLNGEFSLVVNDTKNDSLRFSSIGYKTQKLSLKDLPQKRLTVELEEDRVLLPDIIIHELSAKDFIRKCVTKIPDNYSSAADHAKAFYWNSVRHKDSYTDFYEGYVRITKPGKVLYDSTVMTIQNQAGHIQLFDSLEAILKFDVINQASMFVNPQNLDDWKFEYLYSSEHPEGQFVIIRGTMIKNPFEKSKESNTLTIFIRTPGYAIVRVDFKYQWSEGKRYYWRDDVLYSLSQLNGTVEYAKKRNRKYNLNYLSIDADFSFMKRYNPTILNQVFITHELVLLAPGNVTRKPVVRWNDYLDALQKLDTIQPASGQH